MIDLFALHPSRIFLALLCCAFLLAITIVFTLPVVDGVRFAFAFLLLGALVYYVRRDVWMLLPSSHVALRLDVGRIVIFTRDGSELPGQILPDSVVTPFLTILNIMPQGKTRRRSIVIFPDSLDSERFRELRVLLKWRD